MRSKQRSSAIAVKCLLSVYINTRLCCPLPVAGPPKVEVQFDSETSNLESGF